MRGRLRQIRRSAGAQPSAAAPSPSRGSTGALAGRIVDEIIVPASAPADHFAAGFAAACPFRAGDGILFFDLETTGLSWRDRIIIAGLLFAEGGGFRIIQEVAVDVADERSLLEEVLRAIEEHPCVVTYNGRSFDMPMLRRRLAYHSLPDLPAGTKVVDLLHAARRRYRGRLSDCRLGTIEREVLGKRREGPDIPGAEVPLRFEDYARSGDPRHLDPILYHNRIDLTTLAALYPVLSQDAKGLAVAPRRSGLAGGPGMR
ncbi:MAG: ribonuclease H-like domain-containing protein [Planctomycetota bacterium]